MLSSELERQGYVTMRRPSLSSQIREMGSFTAKHFARGFGATLSMGLGPLCPYERGSGRLTSQMVLLWSAPEIWIGA